jgi:hypothetical protein
VDQYVYLLLALPFFITSLLIAVFRSVLRRLVILSGLLGGAAGLLAEFWYLRDYWQPPSLFGAATISIEDFLFGFGATALAASAYKFIKKKKLEKQFADKKKLVWIYFFMGLTSLLIFNNWLGINSIIVSSVAFLLFTLLIIYQRRDLISQSLFSAIFLSAFALAIYLPLFNVLSPDYIEKYFLLTDSPFNPTFFGVLPAAELLWYFCWGSLAGILYDFASGSKLEI